MSMSEITVTLSLIIIGAIVLFFAVGFILSRFTKSEVSFEAANPERDLRKSTILDPEDNLIAEANEYYGSENMIPENDYDYSYNGSYSGYSTHTEPSVVYNARSFSNSPVILNPRINNTRILFH